MSEGCIDSSLPQIDSGAVPGYYIQGPFSRPMMGTGDGRAGVAKGEGGGGMKGITSF